MPSFDKDSLTNTFTVAVAVCLVCSVLVSGMAVALRPAQLENRELDKRENILRAAGMLPSADGRSIDELFGEFTVRAVDLETGRYRDDIDPTTFDPIRAAKDPAMSRQLSSEEDIATLRRRENVSLVYIRRGGDGIDKLVFPVRGYGLWGTLFGYLALDGDLETIAGLGFYQHKETPGLGGEVDNPAWRTQWQGVRLYAEGGEPEVRLVKTRSPDGAPAAAFEVDALSGATFTTKGVENLVRFWAGELGFGPYIERLRTSGSLARG